MTQALRLCSLVACAAALAACHLGDPLDVRYASPEGELQTVPLWLEVGFSQPIVDLDAIDAEPEGLELAVDPHVSGQLRFPTPSTLQYHFGETVPPAQQYRVTVGSGLRSVDGDYVLERPYAFTFVSNTNGITGLERVAPAPRDGAQESFPQRGDLAVRNMGRTDRLLLRLRYPEEVSRIESLLEVVGIPMSGGDGSPLDVDVSFPTQPTAPVVLIAPRPSWPVHTHLSVQLGAGLGVKGIPAGKLRTHERISWGAATYGPLQVVSGPDCRGCRPPPVLRIVFSTPVTCERAMGFIAVDGIDDLHCASQPDPTVVRIEPLPAFASQSEYRVELRPGVTDAFGQVLERGRVFHLATGDDVTRFARQRMFYVLERGRDADGIGHEEKVYATAMLRVAGARLPFAQAWGIIAQENLQGQVAWKDLPEWLAGGDFYHDERCSWDAVRQTEVCAAMTDRREPGSTLGDEIHIPNAVTTQIDVPYPDGWSKVRVPLAPFLGGKGGVVILEQTPLAPDGSEIATPVLRLLDVTDIGITARYSPSQLVVLAARFSDGRPIPGAEVKVFTADVRSGAPAARGATSSNGVAVFSAAELVGAGESPDLHNSPVLVVVTTDDDEAFVWSEFAAGGRRASRGGPRLVGSVYTDRGIYQPGETVSYRVVARGETVGGFATPSGPVQLSAAIGFEGAGTSEPIYAEDLILSPFGTVHGAFPIPPDAARGDYRLVATVGAHHIAGRFTVAELRRTQLRVGIHPDASDYSGGEMTIRIDVDDAHGAPGAGLDVHWTLRHTFSAYGSRRFPRARFTDVNPSTSAGESASAREFASEFVSEGTALLDEGGGFELRRKVETAGHRGRVENLTLSATVEDANGQRGIGQRTVHVHPADFHLGIIARGYLAPLEEPYSFAIVAVSGSDAAVEGVRATVSMRRDRWVSRVRPASGDGEVRDRERPGSSAANVCRGKTDDDGRLACEITPTHGGPLRLRVQAKDAHGRTVRASRWLWVTGDPRYVPDPRDRGDGVDLMLDAATVPAGKTTEVAFTSPFDAGLALVTVEREDILWRKVVRVGASGAIDIPIQHSWAPNVFISVTIVRGRVRPARNREANPERDKPAYACGLREVKIAPTEDILDVAVSTNAGEYEPETEVRALVATKDQEGDAVVTEVNLYAVAEGALRLSDYATPNLIDAVFQSRPYSVLAMDTHAHILGRREYGTQGTEGSDDRGAEDGGGDAGGAGAARGDLVRGDYAPLAVWLGSVVTDADGEAERTFTLPGDQATYRLMAVAVGKGDRFGSAETSFEVRKSLVMRPAMPRFVRPGDRMQAGVFVNQLSGEEREVEVELAEIDSELLGVRGERARRVRIGAYQTVALRWDLDARDAEGTAAITFLARMGERRDRLTVALPVRRLHGGKSRDLAGVLGAGQRTTRTLAVPAVARPVDLAITVSGLPLAVVGERLRNLLACPYANLEQRTSTALALVAGSKLAGKLGPTAVAAAQADDRVETFIGGVATFRCADAGFDYFPGCAGGSQPNLTAHVLEGLLAARGAGHSVPESLVTDTAGYLHEELETFHRRKDRSRYVGGLRVLAGMQRAPVVAFKSTYAARADLPPFAAADLVRAMYARTHERDPRITRLIADIDRHATVHGDRVVFRGADPEGTGWAWDSDVRTTASVLRMLVEIDPSHVRVPALIAGLVDLDGGTAYHTPRDLSQTVLAFAAAAAMHIGDPRWPVAAVDISGTRDGDGALFAQQRVGAEVLSESISGGDLGPGPYGITLKNSGDGPLYYGAFLHTVTPASARLPEQTAGFRVERGYSDEHGDPIGAAVQMGDVVTVSLRIWADQDGRMVVIDDPLPAGLEPILAERPENAAAVAAPARRGQRPYRERRDDRVVWTLRRLRRTGDPSRPLELHYRAKAVIAGRFYAPGTTIQRAGQPGIRGRGAGRVLRVRPR